MFRWIDCASRRWGYQRHGLPSRSDDRCLPLGEHVHDHRSWLRAHRRDYGRHHSGGDCIVLPIADGLRREGIAGVEAVSDRGPPRRQARHGEPLCPGCCSGESRMAGQPQRSPRHPTIHHKCCFQKNCTRPSGEILTPTRGAASAMTRRREMREGAACAGAAAPFLRSARPSGRRDEGAAGFCARVAGKMPDGWRIKPGRTAARNSAGVCPKYCSASPLPSSRGGVNEGATAQRAAAPSLTSGARRAVESADRPPVGVLSSCQPGTRVGRGGKAGAITRCVLGRDRT